VIRSILTTLRSLFPLHPDRGYTTHRISGLVLASPDTTRFQGLFYNP
jgi:hypothetical protein